ncbi:olfactory receptor 5W2-like isoform X1, partial [Cricetulus griseus]
MEVGNCSATEFLFLGITNNPVIKVILFTTFLYIYLLALCENHGIIILIRVDQQLHTTMYFFLSHLSFCDVCYSTAVCPKMLVELLAKSSNSIPFLRCVLQFFIFCIFTDVEYMLLAMMAFDQYKAISNPLLYAVDMSSKVCYQLLAVVYLVGIVDAVIHTTLTLRLSFCGSKDINLFFCDLPLLYLLWCSDIQVNEL